MDTKNKLWKILHSDEIKEYNKNYYLNNKDKIKEYYQVYDYCSMCKCYVQRMKKNVHNKSKKHQKYLAQPEHMPIF
jgi:hypothetical protein